MASKGGISNGKRSSLSRASSSRRRPGRAVTIEDVVDSEDHLHRVSQASSPKMSSANGEVSPEWYSYTGSEPRPIAEPNRGDGVPAQVTGEGGEAPQKPSSGDPATKEEHRAAPNASAEVDQSVPKKEVLGTSPAAQTSNPSPTPRASEQKVEEDAHTSEAGRPPTLRFAENPQPHPLPFQSPMGPWAHPHVHGQPVPPHYRPIYPPPPLPLPPMSPPLFGMLHPPMLPPEGQISRFEPRNLSGYELLASRLAGSESELPIPPIYRRFKDLHHRILLDLADELTILEERLQHLDDLDGMNRRCRNGFLPASRRLEESDPNEVTTARKQLKDQAAYKLFQYCTQFDLLKRVSEFRDAMPEEVNEYRSFLAANAPVVPSEMRFLDKTADLLCLSDGPYYLDEESLSDSQAPATRTPRLLEAPTAPSAVGVGGPLDQARDYTAAARSGSSNGKRPRPLSPVTLRHMLVGACMAIILPILSFPIIAGFLSRMTVVALVGLGMAVVGVQSGAYDMFAGRASPVDSAIALGIYAGFMMIVAVTFGGGEVR
ncbi:hypothetical protein V2A60_000477 [Cordyceps javanica]